MLRGSETACYDLLMSDSEPAEVSDLVRLGTLQFALQPPMNPRHLDFPRYTIPLIQHDYPAKTPGMWNAAYQAFGMDIGNVVVVGDANYAPLILETLRRDPRYVGGGAGVGFKEKAFGLVDELDALATTAGAVNFISKRDARLCGHNTDGIGFAAALEDVLRAEDQTLEAKAVLMLGAGGTARSVAFALAKRGARVHIVNRTVQKAAALAARLNAEFATEVAQHASEEESGRLAAIADIIVNVSTKGAAGPLAKYSALASADVPATAGRVHANLKESSAILDRIPRTAILCDVVIAENQTPFLRQASNRGFKVLDGIAMVINQAVEAFWILHGTEVQHSRTSKDDVARVMRQAVSAAPRMADRA